MNRRKFLQVAGVGGVAVMAGRVTAAPGETTRVGASAPKIKPFELEEITLTDLQAGLESRRWTALLLVQKYLERIGEIDQRGPGLRAVLEVNPDAEAIAAELDRERAAKGSRGPLHGIPVLIKDNIDTHDQMMTTAGSCALQGSHPARDAFIVQRLREAGAVILGKTNLSEWANFRSSHSSSGWSGRGGQTRNPYALDRNPSGSSSGSAVAVSANLCAVALGTETDGSIVSPSSFNGIVGIKPTIGLWSRSGIIPISHTQDTAGPMARTVRDAAALLGCLTGQDPRDPPTQGGDGKSHTNYVQFLKPEALQGARLGIARQFFGTHEKADKVIEAALAEMKRLGAVLIDPADIATKDKFGEAEFELMLYEFKADLNAYLTALGGGAPIHSLKEAIDFNERHREQEMPLFGQDIFLKAEAKGPLTEKEYIAAREKSRRLSQSEGIDAVMDRHHLDALVAPTTGPAHLIDPIYGDRDTGGSSSPAAAAGYPSITVPAGSVAGLPVGISFFGRPFSEPKLLAVAYAYEQATRARTAPQFLATINR